MIVTLKYVLATIVTLIYCYM